MITFHNKKKVSKESFELMKSLGDFILDKFFTKAKAKKLKIFVKFVKGLDLCGSCLWEDTHYRPNEFTIEINLNQNLNLMLNTFAHELVHVKQWAKGEFYELQSKRKVYKFCGNIYDTEKVDYWDLPWEIEAHGRAIGLVVQWETKNGLLHRNLVPEIE